MRLNNIIYHFKVSSYSFCSHCFVHSRVQLQPHFVLINVTRSILTSIQLSATDPNRIKPIGKKTSRFDYLDSFDHEEISEKPMVVKDVKDSKSESIPNVTGDAKNQNTSQNVTDSKAPAADIQNKVAEDIAKAQASHEPIKAMLAKEYQAPAPTNEELNSEKLLETAVKGYSSDTVQFITVGCTGGKSYLAKKYPSVFIDIDDTIEVGKPKKSFKYNDEITGYLDQRDDVNQKLILDAFEKGKYDGKIVFCHSSNQVKLLPDSSYSIIDGWKPTLNRFITGLIPRIVNENGNWEELYSTLAILIYNYANITLPEMNIKQRNDWLIGILNQETK